MGGGQSSKLWREVPRDAKTDLEFAKKIQLKAGVQHVRILLHGPAGAGKSAFINSINSVVNGRISQISLSDGIHGGSFTKKYKTHKIQTDEREYSFVFNDTMGLEDEADQGVHVDDINFVLKGHVRDGYEFKPNQKITEGDPNFNAEPTINDRVHVLVSVVPADVLEILPNGIVGKMRDVRLAASDLGIPQMAILTKIDEATRTDANTIMCPYSNEILKKKVEKLSVLLGLPPNCIFLVRNYHSQCTTRKEMDAVLMFTLRHMVAFGKDFLQQQLV